jgi:cytochrome d ubiquinol oxidase subunit II
MGPVWEVNHVWIIFLIVVLFTAFPAAFAALCIGLFAPLSLVLLGMILRGGGFVLRAHAEDEPLVQRYLGLVFSVSSIITPFALGWCAGVVAAGALKPDGQGGWLMVPWSELLAPFPLVTGLLAVSICSYIAAVFLTAETDGALREDFRRRALIAGAGVALFSALGLPLAWSEAPELAGELLSGRALPLVALAGVLAILGFVVTAIGAWSLMRPVAVVFVLVVLWAWGAAQWPYAVTPYLTFQESASSDAMLKVYLACLAIGAVILVPALIYLFRVFKGSHPEAGSW